MAKRTQAERRKQFEEKAYQQMVAKTRTKVPIARNVIVAFLVGGLFRFVVRC